MNRNELTDILDYLNRNKGKFGLWLSHSPNSDIVDIYLVECKNEKLYSNYLKESEARKLKLESIITNPKTSKASKYIARVCLDNLDEEDSLTKIIEEYNRRYKLDQVAEPEKFIVDKLNSEWCQERLDALDTYRSAVTSLAGCGKNSNLFASILKKTMNPSVTPKELIDLARVTSIAAHDVYNNRYTLTKRYYTYSAKEKNDAKLTRRKIDAVTRELRRIATSE